MADPTEAFFTDLASRRHDPLLQRANGTVRVDLERTKGNNTQHWFVDIRGGDVTVSQSDAPADCVVRTDKAQFDGVITGRVAAVPAMLRNVVGYEGDPKLLVLFRRLFPWPPDPTIQAQAAAEGSDR